MDRYLIIVLMYLTNHAANRNMNVMMSEWDSFWMTSTTAVQQTVMFQVLYRKCICRDIVL